MAILFPRGSHPFDTPWYTWPLAWRGVYAALVADWGAVGARIDGRHTFGVFLHPNPLAVLLTTATAALATVALVLRIACALLHAAGRMLRPWHSRYTECSHGSGGGWAARAAYALAASLRPGASGSLVVAYLLHWLPYATQERQTFLLYYLPGNGVLNPPLTATDPATVSPAHQQDVPPSLRIHPAPIKRFTAWTSRVHTPPQTPLAPSTRCAQPTTLQCSSSAAYGTRQCVLCCVRPSRWSPR